jgi:hypothetical protein
MKHLEKLNSREKIKNFVKELEENLTQKDNLLNPSNSSSLFTTFVALSILVVVLAISFGLVLIHRNKKRVY